MDSECEAVPDQQPPPPDSQQQSYNKHYHHYSPYHTDFTYQGRQKGYKVRH
jgi:hypothetical protein